MLSESWKYLEGIQTISEAIGCSISNEDLFQRTLDTILDITDMHGAGFRVLVPDHPCYHLVAQRSITPELIKILKCIPIDHPLHSEVARTLQPVIVADMIHDPRITSKEVLRLGHRSLVSVPLICGNELVGTLDLLSTEFHQWSTEELRWLVSMGRIVGFEVRFVQLNEKVRDFAVLQERERLSWEIHDGVSQLISSIRLRAETTNLLLNEGELSEARKVLGEIVSISDDAYASLREEIVGLRETLKGKGLHRTLSEHLRRFQRQWGIKTELVFTCDEKLLKNAPQLELQILRIIQEAITNVRRHANASRLQINIDEKAGRILVAVEDDGCGFVSSQVTEDSMGLRIMRERTESLGGTMLLDTSPGKGTRLRVELPKKPSYAL